MKRRQLIELEDQPWFPSSIRNLATDLMRYGGEAGGGVAVKGVAQRLQDALEAAGERRIVDLCSGGGGPLVAIWRQLAAMNLSVQVTLTDKYPNLEGFRRARELTDGHISFVSTPVDATNVPGHLAGLRTIFNTFHHFTPEIAQAILQDAVDRRQAIAIFELPQRTLLGLIAAGVGAPLFSLVATPLVRPLSAQRLLWTYLIPAVPLLLLWDGLASIMRAYTVAELEHMVSSLKRNDFTWQIGRDPLPFPITFAIGVPRGGTRTFGDA